MNEELAQQGVMNLAGLFILSAIPVSAFALWCDYFERYFQARIEERENVDRGEELYRVRSAGFFINLFQILIFFGTTPVRREHPGIGYFVFFAAFMVQLMLQRGLEGKIHGKDGNASKNAIHLQAFRTFFWSLVAGLSYVSAILASVFAFAVVGVLTHAPMPIRMGLILTGMAVGVVGGLCLSFALGALFVRKIMGAQRVPEGETRARVLSCFESAKMPSPELWIVSEPQFQLGSAMMAGFPHGRGIFRPGFFISGEILEKLGKEELDAVVLHEISHWRMQHLKKRFIYSAGLILSASMMTGLAVLCSRFSGASEEAQSMVGFASLLISFLFAFRLLARQVRYQELAADIHSIEKLGSRLSDLASALRKLDRISDSALASRRDPGTLIMSLGHPATEYRIRVLEKYFESKAAQRASVNGASSDAASKDQSKAA